MASVVHDGVLKVHTTFAESLRREGMLIEDCKSSLLRSVSASYLSSVELCSDIQLPFFSIRT